MGRELTVALVGATGVVGAEFLKCMEERDFPVDELRLLATKRSAGRQLTFRGEQLTVRETTHDAFDWGRHRLHLRLDRRLEGAMPRSGGTRRDRVRRLLGVSSAGRRALGRA